MSEAGDWLKRLERDRARESIGEQELLLRALLVDYADQVVPTDRALTPAERRLATAILEALMDFRKEIRALVRDELARQAMALN
jgi:hypothetical protein